MNWFLNLKTSKKLVLGFGSVAIVFILILAFLYNSQQGIQSAFEHLAKEQMEHQVSVKNLQIELNHSRAELLWAIGKKSQQAFEQVKQDVLQQRVKAQQQLLLIENNAKRDPQLLAATQQLQASLETLSKTRDQQIFPLLEAADYAAASELAEIELRRQVEEARQLVEQLSQLSEQRFYADVAQLKQVGVEHRYLAISAIIVVVVLVGLAIKLTASSVAVPLITLSHWADQIADGDLRHAPQLTARSDEVGVLGQSFSRMTNYLKDLAKVSERIAAGDLAVEYRPVSSRDQLGQAFVRMTSYLQDLAQKSVSIAEGDLTVNVTPVGELDQLGNAFALMVRNLKELAIELQEGVAVLNTSSQEILASTAQVSSGAQETATAISEITATIEEVKQTAIVANQKAKHVNDTSQKTLQISSQGREAVDATLKGMQAIREQMHAVAESIMQLNDQSQSIGEIVGSVNDLAEQSNLLGVNASIEAVKSGEPGRGFGVVAQEIKVLAEQSKQATAQVRGILNDIQSAMNKAVLVAEKSGKVVDGNFQKAQVSGEAIRSLSNSIEESSDAALQIAASNQQQMIGMDQVAEAMENIKTASSENVAGTVQTEKAAHNLNELGQTLRAQLLRFKVQV